MTPYEQQRFDFLYKQHLTNLRLQGKRPATINKQLKHHPDLHQTYQR